MSTGPILRMEGIRKTFPGVVALDGVRLELRPGEVHVLLGENGAGKSTLIKILGGALQRDAGTILIGGRDLDIRTPLRAQEAGIGIIYQELHLVPHLSAGENILLGREPALRVGGPGRLPGVIDQTALFREAQTLLDGLNAAIDARTLVRDLSLAQRQMVEIARALSLGTRILVMDEPTSALTEQEIDRLFATVVGLKRNGVAILYVSHRMEEIFRIGDRITVLLDGRYVGTYETASVTRAQLVRLMVNRDITDQYPKKVAPRGEELLRVEHLGRTGKLDDVSFSLHRGEVLGVAGLLGSGRTELARALFGLDRIDRGTVRIRGRAPGRLSPGKAIRAGMGFLTEDRKGQGLIPLLSVKENILIAALGRFSRLGVLNAKRETATAASYVRDLRIKTPGLEQRVIFLSGGNQQKVLLSRWLATRAEIFIFDEPTRGIDVGAKVEIYRLMNDLTARGAAVLMISSELPEVLGMSDRILVFRKGTVAAELSAAEATPELVLHHALGTS